jgi:quinol-cytochrome oxidoreductase complex cytochrome b subunit
VFFAPNALGHPDNYIPANPLVTPAHIVPEWYFLPFYAMLRAIGIPFTDIVFIDAKLGGVITMFGSIALLFVLPWLDTHPLRSARFRPLFKKLLLVLVADFFLLMYIGSQPADAAVMGIPLSLIGLAGTAYYYGFFLAILPWLSKNEKGRELPASIHEAVLQEKKA